MKRIFFMCVCTVLLSTVLVFPQAVRGTGNVKGQVNPVISSTQIKKWDMKADMVVVGFGLAGAAAVIETADNYTDASLIIFEKMPRELSGGQTVASGQSLLQVQPGAENLAKFRQYYTRCFDSNPLPKDYFDWFTEQFTMQLDWTRKVVEDVGYEIGYQGGGPVVWGRNVIEFPEFPGSDFVACTTSVREKGYPGFQYGGDWYAFEKAVLKRIEANAKKMQLFWETPVIALVQDVKTGGIIGVVAQDAKGRMITARGEKGVLLSCGGYEQNMEMNKHFNGSTEVYNTGNAGNTGDAIPMLMMAGAQMWHFTNQTRSCGEVPGIKVPDFPTSFIREILPRRWDWIEIGRSNERFYDEGRRYSTQHWKYYDKGTGNYIDLKHFRSQPVHLIFDEEMRLSGPIVSTWFASPITTYKYRWSKDNSAEIEKGWIIQADTIEELAGKMGRDPALVKKAVDQYNAACDAGVDSEFGREKAKLQKIDKAPFYAVKETPCLPATSGGAKRNTKSEVLDWYDNPIPGLYEAGELGSYVSNLYQNGTYLQEAIFSGRAAAHSIFGKK